MLDARGEPRRRGLQLAVAVCAALSLTLGTSAVVGAVIHAHSADRARHAAEAHRPIELPAKPYVSSNECRRCHPSEYASWSNTYHRRMTQVAAPETVIGEFDSAALGDTSDYRLGRSERGFYVDIARPSAQPERHAISLVTGSHHMQIYWYETGHDRSLGQLPFAYLKADRRWVPRDAIFLEPPRAPQPTTEGRWNASCIACHTTLGQPRMSHGKFDTRVAEFGIACEACHGPGEDHVAQNQSPLARYRRHLGGRDDAQIANPKQLSHQRGSYVCAQCHATWLYDSPAGMQAWNQDGPAYRPGGDPPAAVFLLQPSRAAVDARVAAVVANERAYVEGLFWSDGVVRVSGREFNGMVDSLCYTRGELSCSSCHSMHQSADDPRPVADWRVDQLAVGMDGDRACLQCHAKYARSLEQHTHHPAASQASRCYNCHMPYTSYGLLKALRSHRIDVPNVTATLNAGRPNACNLCHLDKSLGWTAKQLRELYGITSPAVTGDQASVPLALLLGLRGDAGQRALIAWSLGWSEARATSQPAFAPALVGALMDDPYDAVRYIAEHSLRAIGLNASGLRYDFARRPAEREPVAARIAQLAPSDAPAEERARMQSLFERLLRERDDKPMRLLE